MSTTQSLPLTSSIALYQGRGSVASIINTAGFRALIASHDYLALIVPLLPSVCMTFQWRLDTSTLSWSTTTMRPTPLAAKNRRRVGLILPALITRTNNDRSLRCPNTPNLSESRSWQEYRKIWSFQSRSLLRHTHSHTPLSKLKLNTDQLVLLPPQLL